MCCKRPSEFGPDYDGPHLVPFLIAAALCGGLFCWLASHSHGSPPEEPERPAYRMRLPTEFRWPTELVVSRRTVGQAELGDATKTTYRVYGLEPSGIVEYQVDKTTFDRCVNNKPFPRPTVEAEMPESKATLTQISWCGRVWTLDPGKDTPLQRDRGGEGPLFVPGPTPSELVSRTTHVSERDIHQGPLTFDPSPPQVIVPNYVPPKVIEPVEDPKKKKH